MSNCLAENLRGGLRVVRAKRRVYTGSRLVSHAEYAVVDGDSVLVYLIFNRSAWVAVERSSPTSFGKPISPINLKRLRDVKKWALEKGVGLRERDLRGWSV